VSTLIAPSILSCDFGRLAEEIGTVEEAGADWIHVDVMDGHFVPNLTLGPAITEAANRATDLPLDVHLMIEDPDRFVDAFVSAGADVITVHQEACPHLHRSLQGIRDAGVKAGVSINPSTPVSTLREVAGMLDLVLVMSVNPGFGGQAFIEGAVDKVREARELLDARGSAARIEVDGGVDASNAARLAAAGADVLVAGSAIFRHPGGAAEGLRAIRRALD
jgi:ribulose-phosphate 3-epimerase